MKQVSTALAAHFAGEVLTPADCIRIEKVDGSVLALTSHDRDITFEGTTYLSGATFDLSAIKSSSDFSVDNAEITLTIDGERLTKAELLGDNLREAAFEAFTVNWQDLTQGKLPLKRGNVGEITVVDDLYAKVQLRGLFQKLSRGFLDVYSPTCRASFGDAKCGFAVLPTRVRIPGGKYKTGDWFLVPSSGVVSPSMSNLSFEANGVLANSTSGVSGWTYGLGSYWKVQNAFPGDDGAYYLEGGDEGGGSASGAVMSMYQDITPSAAGMSSLQVDNGEFIFSINVSMRRTSAESNVGAASLIFMDANGVIIARKTTGVIKPSQDAWDRHNITEIVPARTRRIRILFEAYKNVGTSAAVAFDNVAVSYWSNTASAYDNVMYRVARIPAFGASDRMNIINNTFAADGVVPNDDGGISSWDYTAGSFFQTVTFNGSLVSTHSPTFLVGGDDASGVQKTYTISQTRDVRTLPAPIDAAQVYARVSGQGSLTGAGSSLTFTLFFLTTSGSVISSQVVSPAFVVDSWLDFTELVPIPAGTRKMRLAVNATSDVGASAANVALSKIDVHELNITYESPEDSLYGYSADSAPSLSTTIDALSFDGDLVLQARPLIFEFGTVSTVLTDRTIEIAPVAFTAQEMYGGKLRWISGANAGKTSIIRAYNATTNLLTMYDTLATAAEVGDRFIITRGCDKRIATCGALKNNINFRGEPYLPGTAKVITYFTPAT